MCVMYRIMHNLSCVLCTEHGALWGHWSFCGAGLSRHDAEWSVKGAVWELVHRQTQWSHHSRLLCGGYPCEGMHLSPSLLAYQDSHLVFQKNLYCLTNTHNLSYQFICVVLLIYLMLIIYTPCFINIHTLFYQYIHLFYQYTHLVLPRNMPFNMRTMPYKNMYNYLSYKYGHGLINKHNMSCQYSSLVLPRYTHCRTQYESFTLICASDMCLWFPDYPVRAWGHPDNGRSEVAPQVLRGLHLLLCSHRLQADQWLPPNLETHTHGKHYLSSQQSADGNLNKSYRYILWLWFSDTFNGILLPYWQKNWEWL